MLSSTKSMSLHGLDGYLVDVQIDVGARHAKMGNCTVCQMQVLKSPKKELEQL